MIKLSKICLIFAWMSLIFVLSHIAFPEADDFEKEKTIADILYDKDLHFLIFGVLSFLLGDFLLEYKIRFSRIAIISIIFCYFYALSDEYHQGYVVGRDVSWIDILFDVLGAIGGMLFFYLLNSVRGGKKDKVVL